jgi:hypothetical protein
MDRFSNHTWRATARGWALRSGLVAAALPLLALPAAVASLDPRVFPPPEVFRQLQLTALACGRENSSSDCAEARLLADQLLDHPRLPASCKDILWRLVQRAVPASINSLERRAEIDSAAKDMTLVCRQQIKAAPSEEPAVTR